MSDPGRGVVFLANIGDPAEMPMLGLPNALSVDADGWAFIPYGDTVHDGRDGRTDGQIPEKDRQIAADAARSGVVQRLGRAEAELIVANFKSVWARFKRATRGLDVFKGHPDAERYKHLFQDKSPRGTISDMEAADKGLRLRVVLNDQGVADVESGWDEFSPYWKLRQVGKTAEGRPIVAPFAIQSVGIVPRGNMPGLTLVNAATEFSATMKKHINTLLAAMGQPPVAADADEASYDAAVTKATGVLTTANAAVAELPGVRAQNTTLAARIAVLEAGQATLTTANADLTTRASTAEAAFKAERVERATILVDGAVTAGRVTGAERDAWIVQLANAADFPAKSAELAALKPGLKTKSTVDDLGAKEHKAHADQAQILTLVNAKIVEPGIAGLPESERYDAAFNAVRTEHPALFAEPAKA